MGDNKHYRYIAIFICAIFFLNPLNIEAAPPRLNIYHFDVNVGDATLILSPEGRAILIDGGNRGRGLNPIKEFLDRAKNDGHLTSLDYVVVTHYDADHIGGFEELFDAGWYPQIQLYDRGNTLLPGFDRAYIENSFPEIDPDSAEQVVNWGSAPSDYCDKHASGTLVKYFLAAKGGEKRKTIRPGDIISLDHGIEVVTLVANAVDIDGDTVEVYFSGREKDCASNDLSVGLLLKYGDFRYLIAGDLTGVRSQKVADVEELIKDDAADVDVYHINHHGSEACSSDDFLQSIRPRVVVVSNGKAYSHPRKEVIVNRILSLDPSPAVYLTNKPAEDEEAWQAPDSLIADLNYSDYDGVIEIAVWKKSYRVYRWRDGSRIDSGDRFFIKQR